MVIYDDDDDANKEAPMEEASSGAHRGT